MTTKHEAHDASSDDPTDLELMLYADGELSGERLAAVRAWLDTKAGRTGQRKLAALHLGAAVVREHALHGASAADGIAGAVMGLIDEAPRDPRPAAALSKQAPALATPLEASGAGRPANDNGRGFYMFAAMLVAAAAAAVLLWGRPAHAPVGGPVAHLAPGSVSLPSARRPGGEPAAPDAAGPRVENGVEVMAVDFGSRTGAVLYVPNETPGSETTTVVWLSDDEGSGEDE